MTYAWVLNGEKLQAWELRTGQEIDITGIVGDGPFICQPDRFTMDQWIIRSGNGTIQVLKGKQSELHLSCTPLFDGVHLLPVAESGFVSHGHVAGFDGGALKLWSTETGIEVSRLELTAEFLDDYPLLRFVLNEDGNRMAVWQRSHVMFVTCEAGVLRTVAEFDYENEVHHCAFINDDSQVLIAANIRGVSIYEFDRGRSLVPPIPHHPAARKLLRSSRADILATVQENGWIRFWKIAKNSSCVRIGAQGDIGRLEFSRNGQQVLLCGNAFRSSTCVDGIVYDAESGKEVGRIPLEGRLVLDAMFVPNTSKVLLAVSTFRSASERIAAEQDPVASEGAIVCWDYNTGLAEFPEIHLQHEPRSIAVTSDRSQFSVLTGMGEVSLYDVQSGTFLHQVDPPRD